MNGNLLGLDIGGTKCAVIYGKYDGETIVIRDKAVFATTDCDRTISGLVEATTAIMEKHGLNPENTAAIGISCGGPLDSRRGVVMSPPNLPGWDNVPVTEIISQRTGIASHIQNDANACALAEWKFGAGKGSRNMVFLTYGTGLGAGLILDGKLYTGTNDNAGEVGHIRLAPWGPVGYGKAGSFEGFCSGGGIAQLARDMVLEKLQLGHKVPWCDPGEVPRLTAKTVADAAAGGDRLAVEILRTTARYMGRGLAVLIDVLNPEVIVLGGIYARNEESMKPYITEEIQREALSAPVTVCEIKAARLGENVGDYAALSIALNAITI